MTLWGRVNYEFRGMDAILKILYYSIGKNYAPEFLHHSAEFILNWNLSSKRFCIGVNNHIPARAGFIRKIGV